jgi:hypothetical protein
LGNLRLLIVSDGFGAMEASEEKANWLIRVLGVAVPGSAAISPGADADRRPPRVRGAQVAVTQALLAWDGVRKSLEAQLAALSAAILDASMDHASAADIRAGVTKLESVKDDLDSSLSQKLAEIQKTAETAERDKLRKEARGIALRYQAYVTGNKLMQGLDGNPFVPFDGVGRAQAALKTILSTL